MKDSVLSPALKLGSNVIGYDW